MSFLIKFLIVSFFIFLGMLGIFHWQVNRIYVPEGKSLLLRYKGPVLFGTGNRPEPGHWAEENQVGILEKLRGPGRHFYSPIWYERTIVDDIEIMPGEVGIVTCKLGDSLPAQNFLVDGEIGETKYKGILRKCLGPGRYKINPYGYETNVIKTNVKNNKYSGWVQIPTGSVGVVTNLTDNPITKQVTGTQEKVLPPGIYPINPNEQQVDIVIVGFWESSIDIESETSFEELVKADKNGGENHVEQEIKGGINFPSSDGFNIVIDFTVIWGIMPDQASNAIKKYGNIDAVQSKIVLPQIESISRNNGSEYSAVKMLVGEEREKFQNETQQELVSVLKDKNISVQYGSIKHIYIPNAVRLPIQLAFISDELKLTREQEQITTKQEAILKEAEKMVSLESANVNNLTKKLIAGKLAEGEKSVSENLAESRKLVASIAKETAQIESESKTILGEAENLGKALVEEAKANKFKLAVGAFGSPEAYNNWSFANGIPEDIKINLFYAGPGTMWTDLKDAIKIMVPAGDNK